MADGWDMEVLIVTARCCRDWLVLATAPIHRCGICGEVPVIVIEPETSAR